MKRRRKIVFIPATFFFIQYKARLRTDTFLFIEVHTLLFIYIARRRRRL